jgi:hypothetical protein
MSVAMEKFFTPARRYQDIWEEDIRDNDDDPFAYTEVALAVPVEDFLVNRWDWKDLRAFLTGGLTPKILWLTKNTFLVVEESWDEFEFGDDIPHSRIDAYFQETSGRKQTLTVACIAPAVIPVPTGAYNHTSTDRSLQRLLACDNDKQ